MDARAREKIQAAFRAHGLTHVIDVMDTMLDWEQPRIRISTSTTTSMAEAGHGESRGFRFYFSKPILISEFVPDEFETNVCLFIRTSGWEHFADTIDEFSPEELALIENVCRGYELSPTESTPQEDSEPHPVGDLFKDL